MPQYAVFLPKRSTNSENAGECGLPAAKRALAALRMACETIASQSYRFSWCGFELAEASRETDAFAFRASESASEDEPGGAGSPRRGASAGPPPKPSLATGRVVPLCAFEEDTPPDAPCTSRGASRPCPAAPAAATRSRSPTPVSPSSAPACAWPWWLANSSGVRSAKRVTPSFMPPSLARSALCFSMATRFSRNTRSRRVDSSHGGAESGQYEAALSNLAMNSSNARECSATTAGISSPAFAPAASAALTVGTFTVGTSVTIPDAANGRGRRSLSSCVALAGALTVTSTAATSPAASLAETAMRRRTFLRVPRRDVDARAAAIVAPASARITTPTPLSSPPPLVMLRGAVPPGTRAPACGSQVRITREKRPTPPTPNKRNQLRGPFKITQMQCLCSHQITQYHYLQELNTNNTYGSSYRPIFQERRRPRVKDSEGFPSSLRTAQALARGGDRDRRPRRAFPDGDSACGERARPLEVPVRIPRSSAARRAACPSGASGSSSG